MNVLCKLFNRITLESEFIFSNTSAIIDSSSVELGRDHYK